MKALKALQSKIFTVLLSIGFLFPFLITNPVLAESSSGQTTLYFTDALNYSENSNLSEFGFASLTQTPPTKQNDSEYPPSLFIKNSSKPFIPDINMEQWPTWLSSWLIYLLDGSSEYNFSFLDEFFGGYELFLPSPYRVVEEYTYTGNDTVKIQGDIIYNLYFKPPITRQKSGDNISVTLYSWNLNSMVPFPIELSNKTITLTPESSNSIYNQQITLSNINHTLDPGESLIFAIEIIPCNKTLPSLITKYIDLAFLEKLSSFLENRSKIQTLQDIGTALNEIISLLEGTNITSEDFAAIINNMISTSFIYDSINHPASVTIPAKITEEDIRVYYLHSGSEMNENQPIINNESEIVTLSETATRWSSESFDRNKILKVNDISADLYFNYFQFVNFFKGKFTITTILYDNNTTIASCEKDFDRLSVLEFFTKPKTAVTFTFTGIDYELAYGHSISLGVFLKNGSSVTVKLLYDSSNYPSALRVKLEETQNIKIVDIISNPTNGKIIPGEVVEYTLNVTSEKADVLQINSIEREKIGDWEINGLEDITVLANSKTNIQISLKSLNNLKEAYGNTITLNIIVYGTTGIAHQEVTAEVSQDAILYDVQILGYANNINISKGENRSFYFVIKNNNTGAIDDVDSYSITASSKNQWPLIPRENIRNLPIGESTKTDDARVVIHVPTNTTLNTDIVTITVTSDSNPSTFTTINVTVYVLGDDFLENIYSFFNNAAETIGLNEIFGEYGAIALVSIIMIIILFLVIILVLMFTTKSVRIICIDRIKEIDVMEKAIFELVIQNPSKKTQSYEISTQQTAPSSKWMIEVEPQAISIDGRQSKTIQIMVTPAESNISKDWTQVAVHVKKTGRKKTESIDLITMIKEGKTLLKLESISHWPTVFNSGDRVTTLCSISNNGTISANNLKVFFYLNGKQKNVAEVTIPAESIADIQIPWIAVKGKNAIRIRLKE